MSLAERAERSGLHRVGARPKLKQYLAEAWARRDFAVGMARYRITAEDERNRLGLLWVVLRPTLNALIYGLIFGLLQGSNRPHDYAAFVVVGVFLFEFFQTCLNQGAKAITGNRSLVQSLSFPRITLPVSVVIQNFLKLIPMLAVMVVALLVLGQYPTWSWLMMIPLLLLFSVFNLGVALITARLTVHLRDLTQLLPFVSRILFYTSGVLFQVDRIFTDHPWVEQAFKFNPVYDVVSIARGVLMTDRTHDPAMWIYLGVWTVVSLVGGVLFFWAAEERYGRVD